MHRTKVSKNIFNLNAVKGLSSNLKNKVLVITTVGVDNTAPRILENQPRPHLVYFLHQLPGLTK